jgi:osmotically inducible protein OsmC
LRPQTAADHCGNGTGGDADEFQRLANGAKENCPISKALRAVEVTLTATLNP